MTLKDDDVLPEIEGLSRPYTLDDVRRLRGSVLIEHTLARKGAEELRRLIKSQPYIHALGAMSGNQAMQMVRAGLKSIYVSGWQCAADANLAGHMYPDQSLYPANSVPHLVQRINQCLQRADQIECSEGGAKRDWYAPIMADAEAGFGGPLNAYELMKAMIEAGAAGVHFEDQLASEKKCGHLGGKVLVPTRQFIKTLIAARLAADVCNIPTVLVARTDADSAKLITSDIDPYDHEFILGEKLNNEGINLITGQRTTEGFHRLCRTGLERCIARGLAYAPYADMIWMETSRPDLEQARQFATAIHKVHPDKPLMYNCSPSFNWGKHLSASEIDNFQLTLGEMGYKFQFVTLAGFHSLNHSMFDLASDYRDRGMAAYSDLQTSEFFDEEFGYTAVRHQREVGTGYFDEVRNIIMGGETSTGALQDSTEKEQF